MERGVLLGDGQASPNIQVKGLSLRERVLGPRLVQGREGGCLAGVAWEESQGLKALWF